MVMGYTTAAERFLGEGGRLHMFHHWLAIDGYSPDAREWLTQWAMQWAPQLPGSHFLLHSRMVAMAVSVAALILRRTLHSYTDEAEFLATLEATRRGAPDRIRED